MNNVNKSSSIPALQCNQSFSKDDKEKANIFAHQFEKVSSDSNYTDTFRKHKDSFEKEHQNIFNRGGGSSSVFNTAFKMSELKKALKKCRNTSPGQDMLCYEMFCHLSQSAKELILCFLSNVVNN